jgi:hypothetical protein
MEQKYRIKAHKFKFFQISFCSQARQVCAVTLQSGSYRFNQPYSFRNSLRDARTYAIHS